MKSQAIRADLLMLLAAAIWGFAFVAQREGMETMGPFLFNTARFFIGTVFLFPIVWYLSKKNKPQENKETSTKKLLFAGFIAGLFLFMASSFQQVGIQYTTAGKAGFITGFTSFLFQLLPYFLVRGLALVPGWAPSLPS
jgi:drug/metabolite transporter (DMT)-like permease